MKIRCKNCGTYSDYRLYGTTTGENTIIEIRKCACGRLKQQIFWSKTAVAEYEDNSLKEIKKTIDRLK